HYREDDDARTSANVDECTDQHGYSLGNGETELSQEHGSWLWLINPLEHSRDKASDEGNHNQVDNEESPIVCVRAYLQVVGADEQVCETPSVLEPIGQEEDDFLKLGHLGQCVQHPDV